MTYGVTDLTITYHHRTAVDRVTFRAGPGEIVAVVGGDGAGKSSLLRALVGLVRPRSGRVDRPPERNIGYMPGSTGVYDDLTVLENLSFFGRAYGLQGPELITRIDEVLAHIGLGAARVRLAGHLSGGMRRKLALGCSLLHIPELLVLDEPTTGIDPVSRAELWRLIAGAAAGGAAVVVATTYIDEAKRASSVIALDEGSTLLMGSAVEIIASVPGALFSVTESPGHARAWRRGKGYRVWSPTASVPDRARRVEPDLQDAIVVAALNKKGAA